MSRKSRISQIAARVARNLTADEFPAGMSDKGKSAFVALQKAVVDKQILNVDYNDIKSILGYNFEKAEGLLEKNPAYPWLSNFLYAASSSSLSFQSLDKYIRDVKKFIQSNSKDAILQQYRSSPDNRGQQIVDDWDGYAHAALEYLDGIESWKVVGDLLKEVKQYIVKGRRPIERAPDYVAPYVPPIASSKAQNLVKAKLLEIVDSQKSELIEKMANSVTKKLANFPVGKYADVKKYLESNGIDEFSGLYKSANGSIRSDFKLVEDFERRVRAKVEQQVQDMIDRYVFKNVSKIAPIIHTKGEPKSVKVGRGELVGWGLSGSIHFEFSDGAGFTVNNQAVMKFSSGGMWSGGGKQFFQFPTTFHGIRFKDGTVKAMLSEEDMNEVWAKEDNQAERTAAKITDYPHRTQGFAYDCGATAVLTVLQYYGYNNDKLNEQSVFDAIGTSLEGTDNEGIERGLQKLGMAFERVTNLQDLDRHLDEGHPVVVCPQQWVEDGLPVWHYEVVIAKEGDRYIISDPWSINLVWVSSSVFDLIWHDQPDEEFDRWGVAVMGEAKYHGGIVPMDVKLAQIAERVARNVLGKTLE